MKEFVIVMLVITSQVKRARIVASSDEEDTSDTKKPLVNGHGNASPESSKKPDDDSIDKFINMWEMVYPFVDKMVSSSCLYAGTLVSLCLYL